MVVSGITQPELAGFFPQKDPTKFVVKEPTGKSVATNSHGGYKLKQGIQYSIIGPDKEKKRIRDPQPMVIIPPASSTLLRNEYSKQHSGGFIHKFTKWIYG